MVPRHSCRGSVTYGLRAFASRAFCLFQQVGQRHSTVRVPSARGRRVRRQPKVALMSVWAVFVSGAVVAQTTQWGRSNTSLQSRKRSRQIAHASTKQTRASPCGPVQRSVSRSRWECARQRAVARVGKRDKRDKRDQTTRVPVVHCRETRVRPRASSPIVIVQTNTSYSRSSGSRRGGGVSAFFLAVVLVLAIRCNLENIL